jgi:hypothetical protein
MLENAHKKLKTVECYENTPLFSQFQHLETEHAESSQEAYAKINVADAKVNATSEMENFELGYTILVIYVLYVTFTIFKLLKKNQKFHSPTLYQ